MAYQYRYFKPLSLPTEDLKDSAVTEDKIAPEAVGTAEIQDGAVKSQDIAAGAVTGPKLAAGAVSTDKIQDGSVTPGKLSVAVITRPLVPGVSSAEIVDGQVTASKLAAGTFTTDKIADGAVTKAKLGAGSVDRTKIEADAVGGNEIEDGAVSENKIGTDAVVTAKIKDENVTESKLGTDVLANRMLKSFLRRNYFRHFDFFGTNITGWGDSGEGEVRVSSAIEHGGVGIYVLPAKTHRINWNDFEDIDLQIAKPIWMCSAIPLYKTYVTIRLSLVHDANNFIEFKAEDNVGGTPTWHARCMLGGSLTDVDTGVAVKDAVTEYQLQHMRIEVIGPSEVRFYIDNVLRTTITTNVFTDYTEPQMEIKNNHGSAGRWLFPEYSTILGQRWS